MDPNALNELEETIKYLQDNFTDKEIKKLADKIEIFTETIFYNPYLFPKSSGKNIHKAIILKFNTVYYRVTDRNVEILSFSQMGNLRPREKFETYIKL